MAKPEPLGGLVVRYDYLWKSEERTGREEGAKDRPCAVVVGIKPTSRSPERAILCGITHSQPVPPEEGIEIPPRVKQHLGLDQQRSWIITSEINLVDWDDPGLVPVSQGHWAYGFLPPALARQVHTAILARRANAGLGTVNRPQIEQQRAARDPD